MANGLIHDTFHKYNMLPISILSGIGTYYFTGDLTYSAEIGIFIYLGQQLNRLMTPDSDQNGKTYQDYLSDVIDPYFSKFWYYLWYPYAVIIKHRHWTSHGIIIGAIIRLIYLFIAFSPIIAALNLHNIWIYYWDYSLAFIIGFILGDIYHILLDYTFLRPVAEKIIDKWLRIRT